MGDDLKNKLEIKEYKLKMIGALISGMIDLSYTGLIHFNEGLDNVLSTRFFMLTVVQNYVGNLIMQIANGDISAFKEVKKDILEELIKYLDYLEEHFHDVKLQTFSFEKNKKEEVMH